MAKILNSVIGIDLGRHAFKSVLLKRRGDGKLQLCRYAVRAIKIESGSEEEFVHEISALLEQMGGRSKACAVAFSHIDGILRNIEQPSIPRELLRDALRFNGMTLLNQDTKNFVFDCLAVEPGEKLECPEKDAVSKDPPKITYLVGGIPREQIEEMEQSFAAVNQHVSSVQLAPLCNFNAFAFSRKEAFEKGPFLLVDIGHSTSTIVLGRHRQFHVVRTIDYGGQNFINSIIRAGNGRADLALGLLEDEDFMVVEIARRSLVGFAREIRSIITYLQGSHDESVTEVFFSGAAAESKKILELLSGELYLPCVAWDPSSQFEIALPPGQKAGFAKDMTKLNIACGAAASLLRSNTGEPALYLNLYEENETERIRKKRDPVKTGIALLVLLVAGIFVHFTWKSQVLNHASGELMALETEWKHLEPKAKAAGLRESEMERNDKLTNALVHRIENRFYWGTFLDQVFRNIPPDIQINDMEASVVNTGIKKASLSLNGMAAGKQPRGDAENFRTGFQKQLSNHYQEINSSFRSLEDGPVLISFTAPSSPTAIFVIDMDFISPDLAPSEPVKTARSVKK